MGRHKSLDTPQQKPHAALTIIENKPPRGQTFSPPALDRLAGDVESLADIIDAQNRLGQLPRVHLQRHAHLLDKQAKIVLKSKSGQKFVLCPARAIAGDLKDHKFDWVGFCGIDQVKEILGGGNLLATHLLRRKCHLPRELGETVESELTHKSRLSAARAGGSRNNCLIPREIRTRAQAASEMYHL